MPELIYPELSYAVQGCFYDVYNTLRYLDLTEAGWEQALLIALSEQSIAAQNQVEYELRYQGYRVGRFFIDIVVDLKLPLEIKVEDELLPIDEAQVLAYLKATDLKLGILVNFGGKELQFKRIPNFVSSRSTVRPVAGVESFPDDLLYPELTAVLREMLYQVHAELGPGFMHMHYRRATQIELRRHTIPYEVKKEIALQYHGHEIERRNTRLIVVDNQILLAPIAVRRVTPVHAGRLRQYLKILGLQLGLIANFHATSLHIETVRI